MAIITAVPGITANILVDGAPLREYIDTDDDEPYPDQVTKYVECLSGANFAVSWSFNNYVPPKGDCVVVGIYMDGIWADGTVRRLRKHAGPLHHTSVFNGARWNDNGVWKERLFRFADIVIDEDGPASKPLPELKHLGTITLKFQHAQYLSEIGHSAPDIPSIQAKPVHEKHLKGEAISHQVSLGESRLVGPVAPPYDIRFLDHAKPFARYTFRYRSRKSLQALYLIPRSPSPVPLEDRPEETLSREELLELLRTQKRRQEEHVKIKQEVKRERLVEDDDDDDLIVVSSRPPTKKHKVSVDVQTGVESIDLTDD